MSLLLSTRLRPLRSEHHDTHLSLFPQTLTITEIVQVILLFVARQILYFIGWGKDGESFVLPQLRLSTPFRITRGDLERYAAATGASEGEPILSNAAQACLLLSAFSEPAMLLLLASNGCPVRPLGAVNARNKFELLASALCTVDALVNMNRAELRARLLTTTRKAKKGLEIDLEVDIVNLEEDVIIFRQKFTMLQFMKFKTKPGLPTRRSPGLADAFIWPEAETKLFKMTADDPFKWSGICKDYNPIHISTLSALLFGFGGRIAHGNHALSLGVAQLTRDSGHRFLTVSKPYGPAVMEVQFHKPIVLPTTLTTQILESDDNTTFRITKGDQTYVTATVGPLARNR